MKPGFDLIEARRMAQAYLQQAGQHGDDLLPTNKAAEFVGCPTREAFRLWARRHRLVPKYRGRILLFSKLDLRAEIERETLLRQRGRLRRVS